MHTMDMNRCGFVFFLSLAWARLRRTQSKSYLLFFSSKNPKAYFIWLFLLINHLTEWCILLRFSLRCDSLIIIHLMLKKKPFHKSKVIAFYSRIMARPLLTYKNTKETFLVRFISSWHVEEYTRLGYFYSISMGYIRLFTFKYERQRTEQPTQMRVQQKRARKKSNNSNNACLQRLSNIDSCLTHQQIITSTIELSAYLCAKRNT